MFRITNPLWKVDKPFCLRIPVKLPWLFPGAPLISNGDPWNIHGNLIGMPAQTQFPSPFIHQHAENGCSWRSNYRMKPKLNTLLIFFTITSVNYWNSIKNSVMIILECEVLYVIDHILLSLCPIRDTISKLWCVSDATKFVVLFLMLVVLFSQNGKFYFNIWCTSFHTKISIKPQHGT